MKIKTRFAPSPTGNLHFGNVRTALFSWLFAKKNKGKFILRIEDTDVLRNNLKSVKNILEVMNWLGLNWDEKIYFQSKRFNFYKKIINLMLEKKIAYKCYCSEDILKNKRFYQILKKKKPKYDGTCRNLENNIFFNKKSFVIRFKNPKSGYVEFHDKIRGIIKFNNSELDDFIIQRRDGSPTYNFCVVADDLDMKITHVIRGEDHISNTPKQINIFCSLNANVPIYAHLPIILDKNKNKISKKNSNINIMKYFREGFLPEAILNYLVRLGWSHGNKEIFSISEMKNFFSLNKISKSSSIFNIKRLLYLNKYYINNIIDIKKIILLLKYYFKKENINIKNGPNIEKVFNIFKYRCSSLREIVISSNYLYDKFLNLKNILLINFSNKYILIIFKVSYYNFKDIDLWNSSKIWKKIVFMSDKNNFDLKNVIDILRVTFTGKFNTPSISKIIYLIGKKRILYNLKKCILFLKSSFI
ncbi:glutamate--tRNA ligase [Buchnera aphidicola (Ceratovacuna keduensis)]|uniref:glutamate--tRNA ligase n=1 Tax=Buchnera aphidicola TaxID=9 RepID=UPI0031B89BAA